MNQYIAVKVKNLNAKLKQIKSRKFDDDTQLSE